MNYIAHMAVLISEAAQKAAFRLGYPTLREHQLEAVVYFVLGSDVFVVINIAQLSLNVSVRINFLITRFRLRIILRNRLHSNSTNPGILSPPDLPACAVEPELRAILIHHGYPPVGKKSVSDQSISLAYKSIGCNNC